MVKKRVRLLMILSIVTLLIFGIAAQAKEKQDVDGFFNNIKKVRKELESSNTKSDIVLEIGEKKITRKDFELTKAARQNIKEETEETVKEKIIKNEILKIIAKDKGIKAEKKEVLSYIDFVKESFNENEESKAMLNNYFETYGFDKNTFWTGEIAYGLYENYIVQSKLRKTILNEKISEDESIKQLSNKEINEIIEQEIEKLIEDKKDEVEIKRY